MKVVNISNEVLYEDNIPSQDDLRNMDLEADMLDTISKDTTSDRDLMAKQIEKLSSENEDFQVSDEEYNKTLDESIEHYTAIKPNVMLHVAQKTINHRYDIDVTCDDLNLDLEYLMNREIFGIDYDDDEDYSDEDYGNDHDDENLLDDLDNNAIFDDPDFND